MWKIFDLEGREETEGERREYDTLAYRPMLPSLHNYILYCCIYCLVRFALAVLTQRIETVTVTFNILFYFFYYYYLLLIIVTFTNLLLHARLLLLFNKLYCIVLYETMELANCRMSDDRIASSLFASLL